MRVNAVLAKRAKTNKSSWLEVALNLDHILDLVETVWRSVDRLERTQERLRGMTTYLKPLKSSVLKPLKRSVCEVVHTQEETRKSRRLNPLLPK